MKRVLIVILWLGWPAGLLLADVVTLQDGRQIVGLIESGNTQELHIKVGDQAKTIDIREVQAIQFGNPSPAKGAAAPPAKAALPAADGRTPAAVVGTARGKRIGVVNSVRSSK